MKKFLTLAVAFSTVLLGVGFASADVIQFSYVNSNPANVSTLVSVINTGSAADVCGSGDDNLMLHYVYLTKHVDSAHTDACKEIDFDRPTTKNDIVTFDFSGNIGDGMALFGDTTNYEGGGGTPGHFDLPTMASSEPRRGLILVEHRCNGVNTPVGSNPGNYLDGTAAMLDITNDAMTVQLAILADQSSSIGDDEIGPYGFVMRSTNSARAPGATIELIAEADRVPTGILPLNDINQKFLVTPQMIATDMKTSNQMQAAGGSSQKRTKIGLESFSGSNGMYDRNENSISGGGPVHVRCVAAVTVQEILGDAATAIGGTGGWGYVYVTDPGTLSGVDSTIMTAYDHAAIVNLLVYGSPPWGAGQTLNSLQPIKGIRIVNQGR